MKYLLVISLFVLAGCGTTPPGIQEKWPDVPSVLLEGCDKLNQVSESAKLSELAENIVGNYGQYYECAAKNSLWIKWYRDQKIIFEDAHK